MKRTSFVLGVAALGALLPAVPAVAATNGASVAGITYTVPVTGGGGGGQCTIVADRWTADYGPSHVSAQATSPLAIWTRVRCTVTKNGTVWIDKSATADGPVVTIEEGDGTLPVEGITVCTEVESQYTIDARPFARRCQTF